LVTYPPSCPPPPPEHSVTKKLSGNKIS